MLTSTIMASSGSRSSAGLARPEETQLHTHHLSHERNDGCTSGLELQRCPPHHLESNMNIKPLTYATRSSRTPRQPRNEIARTGPPRSTAAWTTPRYPCSPWTTRRGAHGSPKGRFYQNHAHRINIEAFLAPPLRDVHHAGAAREPPQRVQRMESCLSNAFGRQRSPGGGPLILAPDPDAATRLP